MLYDFSLQIDLFDNITSFQANNIMGLGIIFDNKRIFTYHYNSSISETSRMFGFIIISTGAINKIEILNFLFISYVYSMLEYIAGFSKVKNYLHLDLLKEF